MTFFPDGKTFVQIGSFSIAWYAICIITGAFIAYKLGQYNFKKIKCENTKFRNYFYRNLSPFYQKILAIFPTHIPSVNFYRLKSSEQLPRLKNTNENLIIFI